jgi:hypothetical protein
VQRGAISVDGAASRGKRGTAISHKSRLGPRLTAALLRSDQTSADPRVSSIVLE